MKELIEELKRITELKVPLDDKFFFTKKGFEGLKINEKNFQNISSKSYNKTTCFIDGGNAELIKANNLSVQAIRVAAVGYKNNKKVFTERKNFYALTHFKEGKYYVKTIPEEFSFEFDASDECLRDGKSFSGISKIGGFVRRIAELKMAAEMIEEVHIIILDGSLEIKFEQEKQYMSILFEMAEHQRVVLAGLCKTNSLITESGSSANKVILDMKTGSWYYNPIANINSEDFRADIYLAKLHKKSDYVYKIDLHDDNKEFFFPELANNSGDPIFLGYPYGLVEVDKIARISNQEKEMLKTRLMVKLGSDWQKISRMETSKNSHEILDNIG